MPGTPLIACSNGISTELVNTVELAPGYEAYTITIGGAMSGNCDLGKVYIASPPMNIMTKEITMASAGLRIKLLNMMFYLRIGQ